MCTAKTKRDDIGPRGVAMKLNQLGEFSSLNQHLQQFRRSPLQSESLFQSDAEVIQISPNNYLAFSLDIIGDEQAWGLITNPRNLGRHALETALSDLAAVGVWPKGFLQGLIIGQNHDQAFIENVLHGVNDVAEKYGLYLFGGDTASGQGFSLHLTVLGHSKTKPITRFGMNVGDKIYSTAKPGKGNSLVAERWLNKGQQLSNEVEFLALARLKEAELIKAYATSMIDSSDGFLNSLDLLVRVNNKGIFCEYPLDTLLHPLAQQTRSKYSLSAWTLLAGECGDYELIFSVPSDNSLAFENEYRKQFHDLVFIGEVTALPELCLRTTSDTYVAYDASIARNLYRDHSADQPAYMDAFLKLGKDLGF